MNRSLLRILLWYTIVATFGCVANKGDWPPAGWPTKVTSSLWIPQNIKSISYDHRGYYTVTFTADVCYPAKNLIDDMVNTMTTKGWERLTYDPLNPSSRKPLNHARGLGGEWDSGLDKNMVEIFDWREFWKDSQGNIVEYRLEYKLSSGEKIQNKCSLSGFSRYAPDEIFQAILKAFKEIPVKPPPPKW